MTERRGTGYQRLWGWFGLSYASWLVMSRAMLHDMPDDWQERFAKCLEEFDEHYGNQPHNVSLYVSARDPKSGEFCKLPEELSRYRHVKPGAFDRWTAQGEGQ